MLKIIVINIIIYVVMPSSFIGASKSALLSATPIIEIKRGMSKDKERKKPVETFLRFCRKSITAFSDVEMFF